MSPPCELVERDAMTIAELAGDRLSQVLEHGLGGPRHSFEDTATLTQHHPHVALSSLPHKALEMAEMFHPAGVTLRLRHFTSNIGVPTFLRWRGRGLWPGYLKEPWRYRHPSGCRGGGAPCDHRVRPESRRRHPGRAGGHQPPGQEGIQIPAPRSAEGEARPQRLAVAEVRAGGVCCGHTHIRSDDVIADICRPRSSRMSRVIAVDFVATGDSGERRAGNRPWARVLGCGSFKDRRACHSSLEQSGARGGLGTAGPTRRSSGIRCGRGRLQDLMAFVVFVGPSLNLASAAQELEAEFRPPICRGDLDALLARDPRPTAVGIIDGKFFQSLCISPKGCCGRSMPE